MRFPFWIALFALACIAVPARAYELHEPHLVDPAYTQCLTDKECAIVEPACSAPITVNQRHFIQVDIWFKHLSRNIQCPSLTSLPKVVKKQCVKHRCTLELSQPEPPKPDAPKPAPPEGAMAKDPHYCDKNEDCTVVLGDCCEKNFVNTVSAPDLQAQITANERLATCFFADHRHVKNLRCENHQCTADLEVPSELPDPTHHSKDCAP
jgi:hypothetical protein